MDFLDVFVTFVTVFYIAVGIYVVKCFESDTGEKIEIVVKVFFVLTYPFFFFYVIFHEMIRKNKENKKKYLTN